MNNTIKYLGEFRNRLIICILPFAVGALVSFIYVENIIQFIKEPIGGLTLIYTTPSEALLAHMRLAAVCGVIITIPVLIYQMVAFIYPALYQNETKLVIPMVLSTVFLFLLGVSFAFYVVYPFTIKFFLNFSSVELLPYFTISSFVSFVINLVLTFGLVFQLPCLFWFLGRMGIIKSEFLKQNRKYALLIILVIAAIITPPDIVSQLLVALPMLVLYEIGIWAVTISQLRREKEKLKD